MLARFVAVTVLAMAGLALWQVGPGRGDSSRLSTDGEAVSLDDEEAQVLDPGPEAGPEYLSIDTGELEQPRTLLVDVDGGIVIDSGTDDTVAEDTSTTETSSEDASDDASTTSEGEDKAEGEDEADGGDQAVTDGSTSTSEQSGQPGEDDGDDETAAAKPGVTRSSTTTTSTIGSTATTERTSSTGGAVTTRRRSTTTEAPVTTRRTTTTRRATTTTRPTTSTTRATTSTTRRESQPGRLANPNDYKVIPGFDPDENLPSDRARRAYDDWWAGNARPDKNWQDSPHELFAAVNRPVSLGSYHYARSGGFYLASITDFLRTTGDPKALDELVTWSKKLRSNLKDHDGRGYTYFQYHNPAGTNSFAWWTDTNFLDESMLAGVISNIAWAMHENRGYSSAAASEADFWFAYLDRNWVPKWLARSTVRQSSPYVPPSSLGLQNAVGWRSPDNSQHDDTQPAYDPANPKWSGNGINHILPVREFGHPYIMSTYQYLVMGKYFQETGKPVMGTPNRSASDYLNEANTRHDFWYAKTRMQSDGSREWFLNLSQSKNGLRADAYSQSVNIYLNALHWHGFRNFGNDSDMRSYAKVWYAGPNAGSSDVYNQGDTSQMRHFADGTGGNDQFMMMFSSLMGCWDSTGEILRLNDQAILSTTSHKISGGTGFHHGAHYNGILSCELMNS
jgi:hypothetical protein